MGKSRTSVKTRAVVLVSLSAMQPPWLWLVRDQMRALAAVLADRASIAVVIHGGFD